MKHLITRYSATLFYTRNDMCVHRQHIVLPNMVDLQDMINDCMTALIDGNKEEKIEYFIEKPYEFWVDF